jgi:hypothetical protein
MDHQPHAESGELKRLAEKFAENNFLTRPGLTRAENILLDKVPNGRVAVCGQNNNDQVETNNPKHADAWGADRQVRADLLGWLCMDAQARKHVHWRGIQVYGADIIGRLDLSFVTIPFPLSFWHCRLKRGMDISRSEILQVDLRGSFVGPIAPESVVLIAAESVVLQYSLILADPFVAQGEVRLTGARIGGYLDCTGGTFNNPPQEGVSGSGVAIRANGIDVKGKISCDHLNATGAVLLTGAQVGGDFSCVEAGFSNPPEYKLNENGGIALEANRIHVRGGLFLNRANVLGELQIFDAQIGGSLDCSSGAFKNPLEKNPLGKILLGSGKAISADGINITSAVFLRGVTAVGEVRLPGAQLGGNLDCTGGTFNNPPQEGVSESGVAIQATGIVVKSAVFLTDGFRAVGVVTMENARITGAFLCGRGNFDRATLDLTDASAATLNDSVAVWPSKGQLSLDGFVYGRISSGPINVDERLAWLALQTQAPFRPRPYLQLARVMRESGDENGAKRVLIEMEDRLWEDSNWRPLLKWTVAYGYDPLRAFWWAAGLTVLGWVIYRRSYVAGSIIPSDKEALDRFTEAGGQVPPNYPRFSPLIYSIENSLPLVKLGQVDKWQPCPPRLCISAQKEPAAKRAGRAHSSWLPGRLRLAFAGLSHRVGSIWKLKPRWVHNSSAWILKKTTSPRFVIWFLWFQILLGWLLATLFVAGVSGIVRKE